MLLQRERIHWMTRLWPVPRLIHASWAASQHKHELHMVKKPMPKAEAGQVVVAIKAVGVCGAFHLESIFRLCIAQSTHSRVQVPTCKGKPRQVQSHNLESHALCRRHFWHEGRIGDGMCVFLALLSALFLRKSD